MFSGLTHYFFFSPLFFRLGPFLHEGLERAGCGMGRAAPPPSAPDRAQCDGAGAEPVNSSALGCTGAGRWRIPFLSPVSGYPGAGDGESRCKATVLEIAISITVPAHGGGHSTSPPPPG